MYNISKLIVILFFQSLILLLNFQSSASSLLTNYVLSGTGLTCLREVIADVREQKRSTLAEISQNKQSKPPSIGMVLSGLIRLNPQSLKSFLQHHIFLRTSNQRLRFLVNLDEAISRPDSNSVVRLKTSVKILAQRLMNPNLHRFGRYSEIDIPFVENIYNPLERELLQLIDEAQSIEELEAIDTYIYDVLYPNLQVAMRRLVNFKANEIIKASRAVQDLIDKSNLEQDTIDRIKQDFEYISNEVQLKLSDEPSIQKAMERFYSRLILYK